jgi:N utilization substance protein A
MQDLTGGPTTPIEQVTELSAGVLQKLVAAGITTVEGLADMTPEQLEEIPGIGEKTLEKISLAVRHYFEQLEEGEAVRVPSAKDAEVAEPAVTGEDREAVREITEAENVRAAEEDSEEHRTTAEAAVEDIPPADEAEVETLEDQPAEALERDAQNAEEPLMEENETESTTKDEQADKEGGA